MIKAAAKVNAIVASSIDLSLWISYRVRLYRKAETRAESGSVVMTSQGSLYEAASIVSHHFGCYTNLGQANSFTEIGKIPNDIDDLKRCAGRRHPFDPALMT